MLKKRIRSRNASFLFTWQCPFPHYTSFSLIEFIIYFQYVKKKTIRQTNRMYLNFEYKRWHIHIFVKWMVKFYPEWNYCSLTLFSDKKKNIVRVLNKLHPLSFELNWWFCLIILYLIYWKMCMNLSFHELFVNLQLQMNLL